MVRYTRGTARHFRDYGADRLVVDLTAHGVTLPAAVADAKAALDTIDARAKASTSDKERRHATLAALEQDPTADIAGLALAELAAEVEANTLSQARDLARRRLAAAVDQHGDELTASIRTALFDEAADHLAKTAAATNQSDTTTALLRAGRTTEARLLADAPSAADTLNLAYQLRGAVYQRSGIDDMAASRWQNPGGFDRAALPQVQPDRYLAGLRAGGRLWLGRYAEVDTATREYQATQDRAARDAAASIVRRRGRATGKQNVAEDAIARSGVLVQSDYGPPDAA